MIVAMWPFISFAMASLTFLKVSYSMIENEKKKKAGEGKEKKKEEREGEGGIYVCVKSGSTNACIHIWVNVLSQQRIIELPVFNDGNMSKILDTLAGSWFCNPCGRNVNARCQLCARIGGALQPTTSGGWAHSSCAAWIPEAFFQDEVCGSGKIRKIKRD